MFDLRHLLFWNHAGHRSRPRAVLGSMERKESSSVPDWKTCLRLGLSRSRLKRSNCQELLQTINEKQQRHHSRRPVISVVTPTSEIEVVRETPLHGNSVNLNSAVDRPGLDHPAAYHPDARDLDKRSCSFTLTYKNCIFFSFVVFLNPFTCHVLYPLFFFPV